MMRGLTGSPDAPVLLLFAAGATALAIVGTLAPALFGMLGGAAALGLGVLLIIAPVPASIAWVLLTGMSLEMTAHDLIGDAAFQPVIAVVKGLELGLAVVCAFRFGVRMDAFSPAWGFAAMFASGLLHGLHPGLTAPDSLRSAVGSAAPFVFGFCRLPRAWPEAVIRAVKWCPLAAVLAALPVAVAGVRPLFVESGGWRLAGLGHPAFLANVCLPAVYACLIQVFRHGRSGDLVLLMANGAILLATGARAPLAAAVAVCGLSLLSAPSEAFPSRRRVPLLLALGVLAPVILLLAGDLAGVRIFNLFEHAATNLSGRDRLWPAFAAAAEASPWVGWGTGAGNFILSPQGAVARALHTWAAHNEYLRLSVEGGYLGLGLLILLFVLWVARHTAALPAAEKRVMRLAFLAMAGHALTDNLLISTPACVMFAFTAAVFARGAESRFSLPGSGRVA